MTDKKINPAVEKVELEKTTEKDLQSVAGFSANENFQDVRLDQTMADKETIKVHWIMWILIAASLIGTLIVYPKLPDQIPIHWNWQGEIDNYGPRISTFITGLLPLFMAGLLYIMPLIDPRRDSYQKHAKAYSVLLNFMIIFFIGIHWATIAATVGYAINIGLIVKAGIGLLFLVIGNYMGQIRHNYSFGIRTPWTLANEVVWQKTHRLGKWYFIIAGLIFILTAASENLIVNAISMAFVVLGVCYLFVYSYLEFRKQEKLAS